MKKFFITLLFAASAFADVHYAKLEPYETYNLKAAVSGLVTDVAVDTKGTLNRGKKIVSLDSQVDKVQLRSQKAALEEARAQLEINKEVLQNNKKTMQKKKEYYERIQSLTTASKTEKDNAFYDYAAAQNQYMGTREKISSLKERIETTRYNIANLEDVIDKKSFAPKGYIYDISVKEGDFINAGTQVLSVQDISKAKLTLFLSKQETQNPKVYIDGKEYEKGFDRIWETTDETHISAYKAEIILTSYDKKLGQIVQVEVK
ncbi:MAG: efflux RND transporter periplasmic adaptor subunit [Campylobacterota bacterium]